MNFALDRDWKSILKRAWSVRLIGISVVMSGAEVALPYLDGVLPVEPGIFALLSFGTTIAAGVARLVAQRELEG